MFEFRNLLLQVDGQLLRECKDADSAYDLFLHFFQDQYQKVFPKIEKKIKIKLQVRRFSYGLATLPTTPQA